MEAIFLTGATGFIGSYVLKELLRRTEARVFCLVRAMDATAGMGRLHAALATTGATTGEDRLVAVPGNLGRPLFGLSEQDFDALAAQVRTIYHCGALVNFVLPYPALKAVNVGGTQEVLRLACRRGSVRPLHHCSTLRVFNTPPVSPGCRVDENTPLGEARGLHTGYSQSKWVGEQVVALARQRGIPVSIYRPGMVTGHSETGHSNLTDLLCRLIKGCVQFGRAFAGTMPFDLTPVDYVSQSLVELSLHPEHRDSTFHLVTQTPARWDDITGMLRDSGYPLEVLPYERWREVLLETARQQPEHALAPLTSFFTAGLDREASFDFGCPRTLEALRGSPVSCPPADRGLLAVYLRRYMLDGFLPPPPLREGTLS